MKKYSVSCARAAKNIHEHGWEGRGGTILAPGVHLEKAAL